MKIHQYVHEYDFPYHNYLTDHLDFFATHFLEGIDKAREEGLSNVMFCNNHIWDFLNSKLLEIICKNYYVSEPFLYSDIGIYMQDNKVNTNAPHTHVTSHSITGIFYINPPKKEEGGGLVIYPECINNPFTIYPEKNKVYFIPSWLMHTPLPQTTPIPRVSLNWGYASGIRPIHKITGDIW